MRNSEAVENETENKKNIERSRSLKKVTMQLTDRDIENTEHLRNMTHSRSNAAAVSTALSLATLLGESIQKGGKILIEDRDGKLREVVLPDISI